MNVNACSLRLEDTCPEGNGADDEEEDLFAENKDSQDDARSSGKAKAKRSRVGRRLHRFAVRK